MYRLPTKVLHSIRWSPLIGQIWYCNLECKWNYERLVGINAIFLLSSVQKRQSTTNVYCQLFYVWLWIFSIQVCGSKLFYIIERFSLFKIFFCIFPLFSFFSLLKYYHACVLIGLIFNHNDVLPAAQLVLIPCKSIISLANWKWTEVFRWNLVNFTYRWIPSTPVMLSKTINPYYKKNCNIIFI